MDAFRAGRPREDAMVREIRSLIRRDRRRLERLQRLEAAAGAPARIWINGEPVGRESLHPHLAEGYD